MPTPSMTDKPTIWSNGLCQDYSRSLSKWFASRLDARHVLLGVYTPDELEILPPDVGQPLPRNAPPAAVAAAALPVVEVTEEANAAIAASGRQE